MNARLSLGGNGSSLINNKLHQSILKSGTGSGTSEDQQFSRRNSKTNVGLGNLNPLQSQRGSSSQIWKTIPKKLKSLGQKTLKKGDSISQKDLVSDDLRLLNQEALSLARQVGIEPGEEMAKYKWFIELMVEKPLPYGWIKEIDPAGKIVYFDSFENLSALKHPYLMQYRDAFSEILKIQEVINKDSFFSNLKAAKKKVEIPEILKVKKSPRRARKIKVSRNSKPENSGSPLKEAAGAVKEGDLNGPSETLLFKEDDSRVNQIQKFLHDKENELAKTGGLREASLEETEFFQSIYKQHYVKLFSPHIGGNWLNLIEFMEKSYPNYRAAKLADVVHSINSLMIPANKPHLFWVARVYCSLELPEECERRKIILIQDYKLVYVNRLTNIYITAHPAYLFIKELIKLMEMAFSKGEAQAEKFSPFQLFYNQFENAIRINVQDEVNEQNKIAEASEKKSGKLASIVIPKVKNKLRFMRLRTDLKKENLSLLRRKSSVAKGAPSVKKIEEPQENAGKVQDQSEEEEVIDVFNLPKDTTDPKENRDRHILEIATQLELDLKKNVHLLIFINEFIDVKRKRDKDHKWEFRVIAGGNGYWINHIEKRAVREYPYLKELKSALAAYNGEVNQELHQTLKLKKMNKIMRHFVIEDYKKVKGLLNLEAKEFVKWIMLGTNLGDAAREPYRLKYIQKFLKPESVNPETIKDLLFSCTFDLHKKDRKKKKKNEHLLIKFEGDTEEILKQKDDSTIFRMLSRAGISLDDIWKEEARNKDGRTARQAVIKEEQEEKSLNEKVQKIINEIIQNEYSSLKPEYSKEFVDQLLKSTEYIMDNVLSDNEEDLSDDETNTIVKTNSKEVLDTRPKGGIPLLTVNSEIQVPLSEIRNGGSQGDISKPEIIKMNALINKAPPRIASYSDLNTRNVSKLKRYIRKQVQTKILEKSAKEGLKIENLFKSEAELKVPKASLKPDGNRLSKISANIALELNSENLASESSSSAGQPTDSLSSSNESEENSGESDEEGEESYSSEEVKDSLPSSSEEEEAKIISSKKEELVKKIIRKGEEMINKITSKDEDLIGNQSEPAIPRINLQTSPNDRESRESKPQSSRKPSGVMSNAQPKIGATAKEKKILLEKAEGTLSRSTKASPPQGRGQIAVPNNQLEKNSNESRSMQTTVNSQARDSLGDGQKEKPNHKMSLVPLESNEVSDIKVRKAKRAKTNKEQAEHSKVSNTAESAMSGRLEQKELGDKEEKGPGGFKAGKSEAGRATAGKSEAGGPRTRETEAGGSRPKEHETAGAREQEVSARESKAGRARAREREREREGAKVKESLAGGALPRKSGTGPGRTKEFEPGGARARETEAEAENAEETEDARARESETGGARTRSSENEDGKAKEKDSGKTAGESLLNVYEGAEIEHAVRKKAEKRKKEKRDREKKKKVATLKENEDSHDTVVNSEKKDRRKFTKEESFDENRNSKPDDSEDFSVEGLYEAEKKEERKKRRRKKKKTLLKKEPDQTEPYENDIPEVEENFAKTELNERDRKDEYPETSIPRATYTRTDVNDTQLKNLKESPVTKTKEESFQQKLFELMSNDSNYKRAEEGKSPKRELIGLRENVLNESKEQTLMRIKEFLNKRSPMALKHKVEYSFEESQAVRLKNNESIHRISRKGDMPKGLRNIKKSPLPQIRSHFSPSKSPSTNNDSSYLSRFLPDGRLDKYLHKKINEEDKSDVAPKLRLPLIGVERDEKNAMDSANETNPEALEIMGFSLGGAGASDDMQLKSRTKKKKKGMDADFLEKLKKLTYIIAEKNSLNTKTNDQEYKASKNTRDETRKLKGRKRNRFTVNEGMNLSINKSFNSQSSDETKRTLIVEPVRNFSPRLHNKLVRL